MRFVLTLSAVFAAGLLSSFQAMAQQSPMQVPMAPRAIESHLEQKRTQEQREAIEGKNIATAAKSTSATPPAPAASDCEAKSIGKNGKPLAGAAKAAFMKKCAGNSKGKK